MRLLLIILLLPLFISAQKNINFSFIADTQTVSAGVYRNDTLIRTVINNKKYTPGPQTISTVALDDDLKPITSASGLHIKLVRNNIKPVWTDVIGNNSADKSGKTVYHYFEQMQDVAVIGDQLYFTTGYNEGGPSMGKAKLSDIHQKINIYANSTTLGFIASDDTLKYWAGEDVTAKVKDSLGNKDYSRQTTYVFATNSKDSIYTFLKGHSYTPAKAGTVIKSVISKQVDSLSLITGLAVSGKYLFVSRRDRNTIEVLDKKTGAPIRTVIVGRPGQIKCYGDNLFAISGNEIIRYQVNTNGALITVSRIALIKPVSLAVNSNTVLIAEAGTQQLKAYSYGWQLQWEYGQPGGYFLNGPLVTDDKFCWINGYDSFFVGLSFAPDNSFYVTDGGNSRLLHYSANRILLETLMYQPHSYSADAVTNNNRRVFNGYFEFELDYSKLNFWKLKYNWSAFLSADLYNNRFVLKSPTEYGNGKTYALIPVPDGASRNIQLVEMDTAFGVRKVSVFKTASGLGNTWQLYPDMSIRMAPAGRKDGVPQVWTIRRFIGYDSINNPVWAAVDTLASTHPKIDNEPSYSSTKSAAEITNDATLIAYEGSNDSLPTYHLGGIALGKNQSFKFKTFKSTFREYQGEFPADAYDVGNNVKYAGDVPHRVAGNMILTGYHGEFWKASQTNYYFLWYSNGLLLNRFGTGGKIDSAYYGQKNEAYPERAGNAFGNRMFIIDDSTMGVIHSDEFSHGALHFWLIKNTNSVTVETLPFTITDPKPDTNTVYLMKGLKFNQTFTDTLGWTRSPKADIFIDRLRNAFEVRTNRKTYNLFEPYDLSFVWRMAVRSNANLSYTLPKTSNTWTLSGQVSWEGHDFNRNVPVRYDTTQNAGMFLQVLDSKNKPIVRIFPQLDYSRRIAAIYVNKQLIVKDTEANIEKVTDKFFDVTIRSVAGVVYVKVANWPEVKVTNSYSAGAVPVKFQIYSFTHDVNSMNKKVYLNNWILKK